MNSEFDSIRGRDVWVGTVHVRALPGNDILEGAKGAYVPIVAIADDEDEFFAKAALLMAMYDIEILEAEDIQLLRDRKKLHDIDGDVLQLAESLNRDNPAANGCFETYFDD